MSPMCVFVGHYDSIKVYWWKSDVPDISLVIYMLYSLIHIILNNIFLFQYFNQYLPLIELKKKFIIVERKEDEKDEDKEHVTITSSW